MSTPRVTNTPILDTVFLTPSNDTNSVIFFNTSSCIVVNTICISFKVSGISDWAADRSTLINFIHHSFFTAYMTVLFNLVDIILIRDKTGLASFTITAVWHSTTFNTVGPASSLINWASLISNVVLINPLVACVRRATMTTKRIDLLAGDEDLWGEIDIGPSSFSLNLDSVWEGRSHSVSPARSTVLWVVLLTNVGKVVDSINITPVKWGWKVLKFGELILDNLNFFSFVLDNTKTFGCCGRGNSKRGKW